MNNASSHSPKENGGKIIKNLQDKMQKDSNTYSEYGLKEKKEHWVGVFITTFNKLEEGEKIDIGIYREIEPDIDLFLNDSVDNICGYAWEDRETVISKYFILDKKARQYIKISKIDGIDQNNEELSENIGDLFYDSLASFLSSLGDKILQNSKNEERIGNKENSENMKEIGEYLKLSSNHVMKAWEICLPYISKDFPVMKHTTEVKGISISKEDLALLIGNMTNESLKHFLLNLSKKINKDGIADEGRGRKKLSNELFESSKLLEDAGKLL